MAVAHGLGQLREGWGADGAATIWDTTNKIILPGVTDRDCLDAIADICGTVGATEGERRVQVPAVPAAFVRRLPRRRALILEGDLAPVVVKTRPVWARLRSRLRLAVAPPILDTAAWGMPDDLEDLGWAPQRPTVPGGLPRLGRPDDRTEDPAA
jgi:hypothetical protein